MNTLHKIGVGFVLACFVLMLVGDALLMQPPSVALNAARVRGLANPRVTNSSAFNARCFSPAYEVEGRALDGTLAEVLVCCSYGG